MRSAWTNCRGIRMSGHVSAELSYITRLEFYGLEFNDDITTQSRVVKQIALSSLRPGDILAP